MTEYRFHWWPRGSTAKLTPSIALEAQSTRHGAALALQRFVELGCDISAAGAHVDVTDPDGVRHTLVVEEVLDWLKNDEQAAFVQRRHLGHLLQQRQV
jgi:hypothetical protein